MGTHRFGLVIADRSQRHRDPNGNTLWLCIPRFITQFSRDLTAVLEAGGSGLEQDTFLNTLYDLLLRSGEVRIFEKLPVLPNQLGAFKRRTSLKRDDDVVEDR